MIEYIIKRDGREEPFDPNKLNGWGEWGTKSLDKKLVDWSSVVLKVVSSLPVKVPAQDLQDALIKTCLDMNTYEYNRMAGRLYAAQLSKSLYSERKHPHILELHKMLTEKGLIVFPNYTEKEYEAINKIINHKRDITYTYYSSYHIVSKYSLQDRITRQKYETPQFVYMRVAMQTFNNYHESDRLEKLERLYTLFSQRKINVPTPYMTNSLTKNPNVSSCCVLTSKDTAESIGVMNALAYMMTTAGAGLGVHFKTRSLNDPVRGGLIAHQGKIPYIRGLAHTVKSSKQGSRGGMGTVYYPFFDPEIVSLLSLKNPLTTAVNRVRDADYALSINKWFVKRAIKKEPVWLFSYLDAPELYKAFYDKDEDKFPKMMEEFVKNHPDKVIEIRADEILSHALTESLETGRVYLFFADSANKKSPYTDKIYSSNLCIAGDQLVPSNYGLLTAEELYKLDEEESEYLVLLGSDGPVNSSPMKLREKNVDVYEIRLENGMTHVVTDYHKVQTARGLVECKDLIPDQDHVVFKVSNSIHGTLHGPDDAYDLGMYHKNGTVSASIPRDLLTEPDYIPRWIREGNYETKISYIQGLTGNLSVPEKATALFEGYSYTFLQQLQVFLGTLGFYYKLLEGVDGYPALYPVLATDELCNHTSKVVSVTYAGKEDVYCPTVDSEDHLFVSNCFLTRNCTEILLPTKGFNTYGELYQDDPEGVVAFCNLAGIVVSNIENDEEYEEACYYALLMIDEGINNANLPFPALNKSIRDWRSAGVGVLGLAHLMAKKRLSYTTQEGRNFMFSLGERHAYYLYKAALKLGKERGNASNIDKTLFPKGWLPMDTANKNVLELVSVGLQYDWESLRKEIVDNKGIRFTTVSTVPPSETSSISCSTTNGPYMIRELSLVKTSGSESNRWVAPEATKLAKYYERAWDVSNEHHINMYAIFNYWLDQTISADLYYDRSKDKNVSMSQLFKEVIQMAKYGVPTRYYCNSKIENEAAVSFLGHSAEEEVDSGCGSGGCTL